MAWLGDPQILSCCTAGMGPGVATSFPLTHLVRHEAEGRWRLIHAVVTAAGNGVAPEEGKW